MQWKGSQKNGNLIEGHQKIRMMKLKIITVLEMLTLA
jgi:hypothetical protein